MEHEGGKVKSECPGFNVDDRSGTAFGGEVHEGTWYNGNLLRKEKVQACDFCPL
jgi:hypothetical protein